MFVEDIALVKQKVTSVSVSFDDESVADLFADQVEAGRKPSQFGRIWVHTHPGTSPEPSMTDENTFDRVFGKCDWSVMFIIASDGKTFARLRFTAGPGGEIDIPVYVDYGSEFEGSDHKLWKRQYRENVIEETVPASKKKKDKAASSPKDDFDIFGGEEDFGESMFSSQDLMAEVEMMHPVERQEFIDELAIRSDFWDEGSEVFYG